MFGFGKKDKLPESVDVNDASKSPVNEGLDKPVSDRENTPPAEGDAEELGFFSKVKKILC